MTVEFKRGISFDAQNSIDRVLETIAAFANTADGTLFIGVDGAADIKAPPERVRKLVAEYAV